MRSSTPPWPASSVPGVLDAEVALEERLEEVAERRGERHADADEQRLLVREALAVERDPGREDARREADHEALDGLLGRDRGRQPVAAQERARRSRRRCRRPRCRAARRARGCQPKWSTGAVEAAQRDEAGHAAADVERAERRHRDRAERRLARARRPPTTRNVIGMLAASAASDQPMPPPQVAEHHRRGPRRTRSAGSGAARGAMRKNSSSAERAGDQREQQHRDAAELHAAERHRREQRGDEHAADEIAHRAPKRRRRPAYSASAARSGASPKSGQSVGVNTYSL